MSAPLWQAGHLYLPGDIVQPITAPATTAVAITNPGFETGTDAGWSLGAATAVSTADKFTGTYSIAFSGTGGITDTVQATASAVQVGQSITASVMYQQGAASAGHNGGRVMLVFYTSGMVAIGSPSLGNLVDSGSGGAWGQSTVTATAPDTAAFVKIGIRVNRTNASASWADDFTWNHVAQAPAGLVFKAVQANAGTSGTSEPAWPNTVGLTVVDNQVTWEAIAATRVEWTAAPILVSGATEPTWPTQIGEFVADGSIKWEAFSRRVEDENCPNSKIVAIVGSKVFAADRDIARFCATANPLDWTTERDAGYLPLGLQQANANDFDTGVFNQYRSNFVAFNASSFQNWQADPDPAAMALLDQMDGVGSTWQQAAQPVANDLFYLAALGVRTVGIAGGSTNLQAGDVGMPIDPLVKDAVRIALANGSAVRSTYYPSSGQYWLAFADVPAPLPSISGNVPDGDAGTASSGAYTVTGGVLPIGAITVLSGTFPAGLTLAPDGTWSGTRTTPGSYSWTVGGTDADGVPFSTPDTATVAMPAWFAGGGIDPTGYGIESPDGSDWSGAQSLDLRCVYIWSANGKLIRARNGESGQISTDIGATWQAITNAGNTKGGGYHLGFYYMGHSNNQIYRSADGQTYTNFVPVADHGCQYTASVPGVLIAAGIREASGSAVRSVTDGSPGSWAHIPNPLGLDDVYGLESDRVSRFVAVGDTNKIATSTDGGSTWTPVTSPFAGTDRIVLIKRDRDTGLWVIANVAGLIAYSANGTAWTQAADSFGTEPRGLEMFGGLAVMVGLGGTMKSSSNGNTWTAIADNFGTQIVESVCAYRAGP